MTEIVNNSKLAYRERMELFFDIYWNIFVRQKTQEYLDERIRDLEEYSMKFISSIICDADKCKLGIKSLWDFSNYKFKD